MSADQQFDPEFCPHCGGDNLGLWVKGDGSIGPERIVEYVTCLDCGADLGSPAVPDDWDYLADCGDQFHA